MPVDAARPSIAVLPFRSIGTADRYAAIADALPDELIAELSRLRWLFVIARGSSFRFRSETADLARGRQGARRALLPVRDRRALERATLAVTVQLVDTRDGGVVWADRLSSTVDDVHETRAAILARVISALELQIPLHEARAARLVAPDGLDAWSAYHLGLQHMFRFHRTDNAVAGELFARAVAADPRFARAHAGLSFVHFQNAFLGYTPDPAAEADEARRAAERSVELDPLDPFANLTMGRSYWLAGDLDTSLGVARARDRAQPELRARHLRARVDPRAFRSRRRRQGGRRYGDGAQPARSAALRHGGDPCLVPHRLRRGRRRGRVGGEGRARHPAPTC